MALSHLEFVGVAAMVNPRALARLSCFLLTLLLTWLLLAATPAQAQETLSAEGWVQAKVEGCRSEQQRRTEDLARLTAAVKMSALSMEEQQFPEKEARDYERLLKKERRLRLGELEYLLFRKKKEAVEQMFWRQLTSSPDADRKELRQAIRVLTDSTTPCLLNALEVTLLVADFGLPLQNQWTDSGLSGSRILEEVENEYARGTEAGKTLDQMYVQLRPSTREPAKRLIEVLLEKIIETSPEATTLSPAVRQRLLAQLEDFLRLSAEPLRIDMLVGLLVGDFERDFGIRSSESSMDRLEKEVQKKLFKDVAMLRALESTTPEENLQRLHPLVDRWLKKEAMPELEKRIYEDPFSAYWLYVQTGMVARRPFAFRDARLQVDEGTPELHSLAGLSLREAQQAILRNKIPSSYVEKYLAVEQSMTMVLLSRDDFLARVARSGVDAGGRETLAKVLGAQVAGGSISSLDLIRVFVRDASRFQGKPDRRALLAGLRVFGEAKREVLNHQIEQLPEGLDKQHLTAFLRTAGEWMLELEQRQVSDNRFQLSTGGGPIGWALRHTAIGNGLPMQLWAPGGVTGEAFTRMVDYVVPTNSGSNSSDAGNTTSDLDFLDSGEQYYTALVNLIGGAKDFLNIQQYDWKLDRGGKEIAYRIMAKKLGLAGQHYDSLVEEFRGGLSLHPKAREKTLLYDIPTNRMKNLLFYKLFASSDREPVQALRQGMEQAAGGALQCPDIASCGDLSKIYAKSGARYDRRRVAEPGYQEAWQFYRELQGLFEEQTPELQSTKPRRSLGDFVKKPANVRRFVDRYGLRRSDRPAQPFEANIITEGKRDTWNLILKTGRLQNPLLEFNVRYLPWKGAIEYPWHAGRMPLSGRWMANVVPIPYVPWPWLVSTPGFGWAGIGGSMVLQHLAATDIRNGWGMVTHSKHVSSESSALESGMGFASKYFNIYPGFRTWHDTGVLARGPVVGDTNYQFVQWFNRARRNNRGLPESHRVKVARLISEDYGRVANGSNGSDGSNGSNRSGAVRTWVLTTDPDARDYNYRGIFISALAAARENIYIENSFYADPLISRMLVLKAREFRARVNCNGLTELACVAKKRDAVNIYLILPLATDQPMVDVVGRSDFYEMINEGVKIYLWYPRTEYAAQRMLHTKGWLVDYREGEPALTYVGSHNADRRSLWSDNELGLLSTSPGFATSVYQKLFVHDMQRDAMRVTASSFEMERKIRPVRSAGHFVRAVMADLLWFF